MRWDAKDYGPPGQCISSTRWSTQLFYDATQLMPLSRGVKGGGENVPWVAYVAKETIPSLNSIYRTATSLPSRMGRRYTNWKGYFQANINAKGKAGERLFSGEAKVPNKVNVLCGRDSYVSTSLSGCLFRTFFPYAYQSDMGVWVQNFVHPIYSYTHLPATGRKRLFDVSRKGNVDLFMGLCSSWNWYVYEEGENDHLYFYFIVFSVDDVHTSNTCVRTLEVNYSDFDKAKSWWRRWWWWRR